MRPSSPYTIPCSCLTIAGLQSWATKTDNHELPSHVQNINKLPVQIFIQQSRKSGKEIVYTNEGKVSMVCGLPPPVCLYTVTIPCIATTGIPNLNIMFLNKLFFMWLMVILGCKLSNILLSLTVVISKSYLYFYFIFYPIFFSRSWLLTVRLFFIFSTYFITVPVYGLKCCSKHILKCCSNNHCVLIQK